MGPKFCISSKLQDVAGTAGLGYHSWSSEAGEHDINVKK